MEINILFDNGLEECLDRGWIQGIAEQALSAQGAEPSVEMGLVIASRERVQELNKTYLGKDEPTDVLAFAMLPEPSAEQESSFATPPDGIKHLGEVIICYPQAVKQAGEHLHSIKKEMAILIIHGVLHLLGYDHGEPEPARQMAAREAAILKIVEGGLD
jgi:probable rRNA maturation factor